MVGAVGDAVVGGVGACVVGKFVGDDVGVVGVAVVGVCVVGAGVGPCKQAHMYGCAMPEHAIGSAIASHCPDAVGVPASPRWR